MTEHGLAPGEVKRQHSTDIASASTFRTHGLSKQAAKDFLDTPEGMKYWLRLAEADPAAPRERIDRRAIEQLTSGREIPRAEVINEPLVKIVPAGGDLHPKTPYFTKLSELEDALAKGHSINDRFGLPVKSEAPVYDVYRIDPKGPTEVFVSEVASTSELGGAVRHAGGARQYLVPNRDLFTEAVRVSSLGNDLALHNELVVSRGLGAPIASLAESAGARNLRPGMGVAAKGLGVVGGIATAYDIGDTAHDFSQLRSQGNATAAQARIERFAIQNAAGWGGAAAGMGVGAMAGVESGPGLLVTGAIGGIVGAVAGDKVSAWLNDRKINRQDDPQGNTWTFDPDRPERGWTRTVHELDPSIPGNPLTGMPGYRSTMLVADAALSDRLTYQASRTSIELALGSPPQSRDPYTLPASAQDARSLQDSPWVRHPQSGTWQREVVHAIHERGLKSTTTETANPERASELERQSHAIIARNAQLTPAAMAAQYRDAHERNGWSQYGPLPEAVTGALRPPGRVVGSDGDLYERNAQGQWTHDGMLWDSHADGNLRRELEATYQAQQARTQPVTTLDPVIVRPDPELKQGQPAPSAPQGTPQAPVSGARRPDDPDHPDHALLEKIRSGVRDLDRQTGKPWDERSERLSASLLALAAEKKFAGTDDVRVALNRPTSELGSGQLVHLSRVGHPNPDPAAHRTHMPMDQALATPVEDSYRKLDTVRLAQVEAAQLEQQQALARNQADQNQASPRMAV